MDLSYSPREQAFRAELRGWLEENLPPGWLAGHPRIPTDPAEEGQFLRDWQLRVARGGWAGVAWPLEYEGRGASLIEQVIYEEEMARCEAPPFANIVGTGLVGPTLMALGTPEQKATYLPRILRGEEIWCQGYSEPGAGSDLAALQTSAEREGNRFVINGQKIWTSFAHLADRCFLLARTSTTGQKHQGITAFLVDMHQPGVEVRPIHQINGGREFNEMFFTDAVVDADGIVGEVDRGWQVALTLLAFERVVVAAQVFGLLSTFERVVRIARSRSRNGIPLLQDPVIRDRIADYYVRARGAQLNFYRHLSDTLHSERPGVEGSLDKFVVTELHKELSGFGVSLLAPDAAFWEDPADHLVEVARNSWLYSIGMTIAGGTTEIQKNIVAERILGLPKDIKA
jgi:alkylation response protein AidB-like acyl-CoA dehydrogenase